VAYYQQIGRAGRALDHAEVVLLPGREDRDIWNYFASLAFPPEPLVRQTLDVLSDSPLSTASIETRVDLSRTRLEMLLKVLDSDGAAKRVKGGWISTGEPWFYDAERHQRIAAARKIEQQAMLDCGRCDVCSGQVFSPEVDTAAATAAAARIARPGVVVAPRKQWPSGMKDVGVPLAGRISAGEVAEEGRVIGRLSDIGWGTRLRELVSGDDQPVPEDVLDAVVTVLKGWDWAARPVGVVGIGSRTRPHQLDHLARRIADIGRLPLLGTLAPQGERPPSRDNSAQRLAAVADASPTTLPPAAADVDCSRGKAVSCRSAECGRSAVTQASTSAATRAPTPGATSP